MTCLPRLIVLELECLNEMHTNDPFPSGDEDESGEEEEDEGEDLDRILDHYLEPNAAFVLNEDDEEQDDSSSSSWEDVQSDGETYTTSDSDE